MTATHSAQSAVSPTRRRLGPLADGIVLVVGVLVVPLAIAAVFGVSPTAPDAAAYVRMAFTEVIGSTVAIMTALGLLVHRCVRRRSTPSIARLALIAGLIVWWQVGSIVTSASTLVDRLGSVG
ncbi:hypothetical protein [Microbacterium aurantiacum]|uniref:hypothetical protein n=1 Tax=Microbacterium aurantiacum TaxID=162393 RepID=UPI003D708164